LTSGTQLFIRYAFAPNKLRYCGPSDNRAVFDYFINQKDDERLMKLLSKFEGAYPYLQYIAFKNKINDPFDERVVEAYWIGNALLNCISINDYHNYLKNRFKGQWDKKAFDMIFSSSIYSAKPHHSFHVLSGFAKKNISDKTLEFIRNCMINTGKVKAIQKDNIAIISKELICKDNKLYYWKSIDKTIDYSDSFLPNIQIGDTISYHWNWVCDKLQDLEAKRLDGWNRYHINIFNHII